MYAPFFEIAVAASAVRTLLGSNPTRIYAFGEAPQGVVSPYVVWQDIAGNPFNSLSDLPNTDRFNIQINVYAASVSQARNVAKALRDSLEPHAYVTAWRGTHTDPETNKRVFMFDVSWIVPRTN